MAAKEQQILKKVASLLRTTVPDARVLLYGSHARGDNNVDSDWDILVVLSKKKIDHSDYETIAYPVYELGWELGVLFSVKLYTEIEWEKRHFTPFYKNVEKDAITL